MEARLITTRVKRLATSAALALALAGISSRAQAGSCELVMGSGPGDSCCNACCSAYQHDLSMCRWAAWLCFFGLFCNPAATRAACALVAEEQYEQCKIQCAADYPELPWGCS